MKVRLGTKLVLGITLVGLPLVVVIHLKQESLIAKLESALGTRETTFAERIGEARPSGKRESPRAVACPAEAKRRRKEGGEQGVHDWVQALPALGLQALQ